MIDGEVQKGSGALAEYMRLLWLTPAQDRLFAGPASDRRRFLDRLVAAFDPEHAARVAGVRKGHARAQPAARRRPARTRAWLAGLEAHMAEAAVAIAAARLVGLEALQTHIGEAPCRELLPLGG